MMTEDLYKKALAIQDRLVKWRRDIHAHPELGLEEHRTAKLVYETLEEVGIETKTGLSETGVVGLIKGTGGKTVALRADMDALPIQEDTDVPYKSKVPGVMHACGHDGHTAMLLGSSIILQEMAPHLKGNVKLIFQPAEEQSLIGRGGARQMVAEGVLESPKVSGIAALHLDPELPRGTVGIKDKTAQASSTTLEIKVRGKAAHGSRPHQGVDAVYLASLLVLALQGIVSRDTNATDPKVVSIGEIQGGTSPNILASEVFLRGTIRTHSVQMQNTIQKLVQERGKALLEAFGGEAQFSFQYLYPPLWNHPGIAKLARRVFASCAGVEKIEELEVPRMGGEDFSFFAEKVPAVLFRLGCASSHRKTHLHGSNFDFDEKVLPIGAALLASMAIEMLEET